MQLLPVRRHHTQGLRALACWLLLAASALGLDARAQTVELLNLQTTASETSLDLDFAARLNLPKPVEEAMHRGVPVYFVAQAQLLRSRWYWRDERVARVQRSWRVAYQPLTGVWRVGLGGLNQTYTSMADALAAASRSAGWRLADAAQIDPDKSYYLEFSYGLDSSQLPGPMQIGLGGQSDWAIRVNRVIRVEPRVETRPEARP